MKKKENKKIEENESKSPKEIKTATLIYSALIIILGVIFFVGIAIYFFGWQSNSIKKIEKIIPYPAAIINHSHFIRISELNENLASVKKFYEVQDFSQLEMRVDFSTENGKKRLKIKEKEILNRMIEDKAIEILALKENIRITNDLVDQNLARKLEEYQTAEDLKNNLSRLYNWSIQDFKEKVVKPDLYRQELEKKFAASDNSAKKAEEKIKKALEELEKKKNFSEVAKNYSEGITAKEGGELGWFSKDQLIADIVEPVFFLEKGKRTGIIESPLGFHIVEVEDKKTENGQDLVKIRQIFTTKKTFPEFLNEEMKKMKFFIPLKEYTWNSETVRVDFKDEAMKNFEKEMIENSQGDASIMFW